MVSAISSSLILLVFIVGSSPLLTTSLFGILRQHNGHSDMNGGSCAGQAWFTLRSTKVRNMLWPCGQLRPVQSKCQNDGILYKINMAGGGGTTLARMPS